MKDHFIFKKCEERLNMELDIVSLVKQARQTKLLTQVMLSQRQNMLLRFQRRNLVETSSSSSESDSNTKFNTVRLMDNKNPLIRLSIFGRLKKMINMYKDEELELIDRRLLIGLYQKKLKDYDEERIDQMSNITLL